jgi:uncharacterized phage-like protein YoqJ
VALGMRQRVIALIPCLNQERIWPKDSQLHYHELLKGISLNKGHIVQVSNEPYRPDLMLKRNTEIVKLSDRLLAIWNGDESGGTYNCLQQALQLNKPVDRLDPSRMEIFPYESPLD